MNETLIEVSGLSKRFGDVQALSGVDVSVYSKEMFCIVGPDGAGKTTFLRTLCGIVKPDAGQVTVLGCDLKKDKNRIKPAIGYLSQRFSLYGDLSVDENIEFFAEIHGVHDYKEERNRLLDFMRLTEFRKRLADRLSGGMKQKLALACTLIHTPKILFLDEPTTGVDPVSRRDFWVILSGLLENGLTIVVTTPYLDEAERGSRVGFLSLGKLLIVDTPANIKKTIKGQMFEIVTPSVREAHRLILESHTSPDIQLFGDRLNILLESPGDEKKIEKILEQGNITVTSTRFIAPKLENVFISFLREKNGE